MSDPTPTIRLPTELHGFIRLVLGDPAVQARLGAVIEARAFVAEAAAVAQEHEVALDPALLAEVLRPDPLGIGRFAAAPIELGYWPPSGWLPASSVPTGGAPAFDWLWFGERRLTSSFHEDEVRLASALPLNWLLRVRTGIDALLAGAEEEAALPLDGLVFHMSRCGSTLLAQMLGAVPGNVIASEPEPLSEVLLWAWRAQVPLAEAVPAVRAMVAALGRRRKPEAQRLIVKLDAWHTLALPLLHAAFPQVPWVYLFRDPLEVVVSHLKQPGIQIVAGIMPEALFGISGGLALPPLDYSAQVLDAIGRAALEHRDLGEGLFIEYPDLVAAAPTQIAEHFGLELDAADCAAMAAAAQRDAKSPDYAFEPDGERKRAAGSVTAQAAAATLANTHQQLRTIARADRN